MTHPRGEGGAKFVVREQRKRDRLREETQGLADCGRASNGRYVAGCRCDACKAARAAYERGRERARGYGRPTEFVDAEPVRAKVRQLQAQGYTYAEMERLAGVPHSTLHGLMCRHWRTGRPVKRCRRELKFSPDGSTVAVAVAATNGGAAHIELPFCEPTARGTRWLVSWLAVRASRASCAVVDGRSGAGALCDRLQEIGVPRGYVFRPTADQAITAAALICESAGTGGITHIECPALDLSAATATRREIGRGGGWGFGGESSAPIEAAGLALLGLTTSKRNPKRKAKVT